MAVAAESELRARAEPRGGARAGRARATSSRSAPASSTTARRRSPPSSSCAPASPRAPCFLLESAEQGQVGRYSFVGFRPRSILRWSDGVLSSGEASAAASRARRSAAADPYAAVAEHLARYRPGAGRGPAAVRRRRRRLLRLRPGAHGRAARRAEPRPARAARHGADGHRRAGRLRPPAPRADDHRLRLRRGGRRDRRRLRARRGDDRRGARAPARRRCRCPSRRGVAEPPRLRVEHGARGVRSGGRADRRVRPRRRRLPGRPLAALLGAGAGRGLLDLPRPARGQPLALHVLPRLRRLPDRRRLARAAGQGHRRPGRDAADRRHLPARRRRGGGPPPRRAAAQRPQGAGRARDAGRPRPQRPRPGLRVRHASRSTS